MQMSVMEITASPLAPGLYFCNKSSCSGSPMGNQEKSFAIFKNKTCKITMLPLE